MNCIALHSIALKIVLSLLLLIKYFQKLFGTYDNISITRNIFRKNKLEKMLDCDLTCLFLGIHISANQELHTPQQSEVGTIEGFTKSALLNLSIMLPTSRQELGAIFDIEGADIMRRILKVFYE